LEVIYLFHNWRNIIFDKALIELYLLNNVIKHEEVVSSDLYDRCVEVKESLIEFPKVVSTINDFHDLKHTKWAYEPLSFDYRRKSSVRLTKVDRLIFDESTYGVVAIIEELLHYKDGLTKALLEEKLEESLRYKEKLIEDMSQNKLTEDTFQKELEKLSKDILDNKLNLELFDLLGKYTPNYLENYEGLIEFLINKADKDNSKIWVFD